MATNGTGVEVFTWQAPTTNTNGTPLTNLESYNIWRGASLANLAVVGSTKTLSWTTGILATGTYYFGVSAVSATGQSAIAGPIEIIVTQHIVISCPVPTGPGPIECYASIQ